MQTWNSLRKSWKQCREGRKTTKKERHPTDPHRSGSADTDFFCFYSTSTAERKRWECILSRGRWNCSSNQAEKVRVGRKDPLSTLPSRSSSLTFPVVHLPQRDATGIITRPLILKKQNKEGHKYPESWHFLKIELLCDVKTESPSGASSVPLTGSLKQSQVRRSLQFGV